jgi:hypothetical protein
MMASEGEDLLDCVAGVPVLILIVGAGVAATVFAGRAAWWMVRASWAYWN